MRNGNGIHAVPEVHEVDGLSADPTEAGIQLDQALETHPFPIQADTVSKLVQLEMAVVHATQARDLYQDGLMAGLGIDPETVIGLDPAAGSLILRGPAPKADA